MSKIFNPDRGTNFWELELKKDSLKEPKLRKFIWYKPLSIYHTLEFRGLDPRDYYEPPKYDSWDFQAWNVPVDYRNVCGDYYIDYHKCNAYMKKEFPILKVGMIKRPIYCWKMFDNYQNCKRN